MTVYDNGHDDYISKLKERWEQEEFIGSGSGKTNISFHIVRNFLEAGKHFLIFDWKRNYRDLLTAFPEKEILVFTVDRNIRPIAGDFQAHLSEFCGLLEVRT